MYLAFKESTTISQPGDRVSDSDDNHVKLSSQHLRRSVPEISRSRYARPHSSSTVSNFPLDVSPASPAEAQPTIGLIGMGAMGRMYAKYLSQAGWKKCVPA
jgi:6-phosphogluconate dehydrogenase (decarboxylating)